MVKKHEVAKCSFAVFLTSTKYHRGNPMTDHREFDVFLSHSSVDKPWVSQLKDDLQRYGVTVWLDRDQIRPGDLFARALEQGLENSRAVALIVSPEALASGWVREEYYRSLGLAQRQERPFQLIPVLYRNAELPGFLANRSWVDFRDEAAYAHKVWELAWGITGRKPEQVLDLRMPVGLPDEQVPEVAPLPPGSRMPFSRNPLFVGREADLLALARGLRVGRQTAAIGQIAAATGLGGIGLLSQLADVHDSPAVLDSPAPGTKSG